MAKTSFFLDTRYKGKDEKFPLKLRVFNNSLAYITLPYRLKEPDWDKTNSKIRKSCSYYYAQRENVRLVDFKQKFDIFIINLNHQINITNYNANELIELFNKSREKQNQSDFFSLFQSCIDKKKEEKPNAQTHSSYSNTLKHLQSFCSNPPKIENIDTNFLQNFCDYLKSKNNKINSIAINLKNIRSVYNHGIKLGLTDYNSYPFKAFKIPKEKTQHRTISPEDLLRLFEYQGTPSENRCLNLFKLSFYLIGMNFKDMLYAKKSDIYNNRLYYKRAKTDKNLSIKITQEAQQIIDSHSGNEYLLNIIEEKEKIAKADRSSELHRDVVKQTNKQLKSICKKLDINIDISTYYARHTWATMARKAKVDYDIIKLALGHSNKDITAVYIEYDTDLIDEANDLVISHLKSYL